jgi:hypothetical protein
VARFFAQAEGRIDEGFQAFALFLLTELPDSAEVNVALRKLLECRDATHRAELGPDPYDTASYANSRSKK